MNVKLILTQHGDPVNVQEPHCTTLAVLTMVKVNEASQGKLNAYGSITTYRITQ